ncbi:hypothetical protein Tco_0827917, partial [Tanacetum coccineum]
CEVGSGGAWHGAVLAAVWFRGVVNDGGCNWRCGGAWDGDDDDGGGRLWLPEEGWQRRWRCMAASGFVGCTGWVNFISRNGIGGKVRRKLFRLGIGGVVGRRLAEMGRERGRGVGR